MEKSLLILLLLISFFCQAQVTGIIGAEVKPTLNQRLGHGTPYLSVPGNPDWEGVFEGTILKDSGRIKVYYTHSPPEQIFMLTTDSIGGTNTYNGAVAGSGVASSRAANSSDIVKSGGVYYLYATSGYSSTSVYLYTSNNGYSFTDQGVIFSSSLISGVVGYGNTSILKDTSGAPVQIAGKYRIYIEANTGSIWETYLIESTSLSGPWSLVQKITTLQNGTGMTAGGCVKYLDGVYHMFYHFSYVNVSPTYLGYATSTDGITFTKKEVAFKKFESLPYGIYQDQIADMWIEQVGNNTYMIATYGMNNPNVKFQIYKWMFPGTFKQLITNLNDCIGCVGVYP